MLGPELMCWDSNPAKTQFGIQTHVAGTPTQPKRCLGLEPMWLGLKPSQNPWYLVSEPNEAQVLKVSSQKEFSKRQSDRQEVDLIRYREKHTP